jgi:hypothetical protein
MNGGVIMTNIILEPAELAFLLTLLDAQAVPGSISDKLLPEGKEARDVFLWQGVEAMHQHGHLQLNEGEFSGLSTPLILAVAVLAEPQWLIQTTHYVDGGEQRFGHYVDGEYIVEFYRTSGGDYHLVALDSVETAIARIVMTLDVDLSQTAEPLSFSMRPEEFKEAEELAQAGDPIEFNKIIDRLGLNGDYSDSLMETFGVSAPLAIVEIIKATNAQEGENQSFFIFSSGELSWLMQTENSGVVILSTPINEAISRVINKNLTL